MTRFVRLPEVVRMTGMAKQTIYNLVRGGHFPAPVKLGPQASGWRDTDLETWAASRKTGCRVEAAGATA
jgi:prophage regulatory protein